MKLTGTEQLELVTGFLSEGLGVTKTVSGESMLPAIPDGAVVELEPVQPGIIRRGDVVFFTSAQGYPTIHRVSWRFRKNGRDFLQTWGDNNPAPDVPVPACQVSGQVVAFKFCGHRQRLSHARLVFVRLFLRRYCWHYGRHILAKWKRTIQAAKGSFPH